MKTNLLAGLLLLGFICALPGFGWARGGHSGEGYSPGMERQSGGPGMRRDDYNRGAQAGQSMGNHMSGQDNQNGPPCPPPGGGQYSQGQGPMMMPPGGPDRQHMGPPPQQMGYGDNPNGGSAYEQGPQGRGPAMGPNEMQRGEQPMGPPSGGIYPVNGNWNTPHNWGQPGNDLGQN